MWTTFFARNVIKWNYGQAGESHIVLLSKIILNFIWCLGTDESHETGSDSYRLYKSELGDRVDLIYWVIGWLD